MVGGFVVGGRGLWLGVEGRGLWLGVERELCDWG